MKIKKLIVRRTEPSENIIREIIFNENGLSLIIDNTPEDIRESGNSVGKSTVIKIIDLCLGAKSTKELYYDSDTKSENVEIKTFLSVNKVQAELILFDEKQKEYIIRRDLFPKGKRYIFNESYNANEFTKKLKEIIFKLKEDKPTFRQLMPKFIRLDNMAEDRIIKYLPLMTTNDTYDLIYCFLFQIYDESLLNKRSEINDKISECQKTIQILEKSKSIVSLSVLKQSLEMVNTDLDVLSEKRQKLSYMDTYREELDNKRKLTVKINEIQKNMQFLEFEIENIESSIRELSQEKKNVNFATLRAIYEEAKSYVPNLQKSYEDLVNFHNTMIQNRIDFIREQLLVKQKILTQYSEQLDDALTEKEKITVEVLDEGLLDEFNMLNKKIEELSLKKGEIQQSINLLEEQEQARLLFSKELNKIEEQMKSDGIEEKIKNFNQIFAGYCDKLYGEKYLLAYNEKWKAEGKFPINIASLGGNVGTGKKKAVIVAYDLAYMQYAINEGISVPKFVIHDKMENTHINQLKTIFEICKGIKGQYIIPILRERIDKIDDKYIEKVTVLELSSTNKFFGV
ncbi:DUF2326 domain-containing protein [Anthropogastromicrobium aceti]|uniref:DUF2326 domain-containing protein n=1 Tax=Anthropogastromicrobium aceti TaxID=2981768 RepID=UPI000821146B|nr:DUF2326 domain-containing protein [Anthropogastromicrobium aceti]MCU6785592.1 DUF2326 domain-containing protein [Anthropogastromicrobium aceti]SCJ89037.1 Uncharacterised protein [uncultured Lachnospira sp.]